MEHRCYLYEIFNLGIPTTIITLPLQAITYTTCPTTIIITTKYPKTTTLQPITILHPIQPITTNAINITTTINPFHHLQTNAFYQLPQYHPQQSNYPFNLLIIIYCPQ